MTSAAGKPDLAVHIANFLGLGELMEARTGGGAARTLIRLQVSKRRLELRQDPTLVAGGRRSYGGLSVASSTITVKNVAKHEQQSVVRLVHDVCWLLSLASMSRVSAYRYDYPVGSMAEAWSAPGVCGKSWPIIDIDSGDHVCCFVETTFARFRRLKAKRRLPSVIDALIAAETGTHAVEISLVVVYLALEMLKDSWARANGIPFHDGFFRRVDPATGKKSRYGFEAMVRTMMADVQMKPKLRQVTQYRNALVHSGGLRLAPQTKRRAYETAQRLVREYLLRLLGYKGPYVEFGKLRLGQLD